MPDNPISTKFINSLCVLFACTKIAHTVSMSNFDKKIATNVYPNIWCKMTQVVRGHVLFFSCNYRVLKIFEFSKSKIFCFRDIFI